MAEDEIHFEPDPFAPTPPNPDTSATTTAFQSASHTFDKPQDDFSSPVQVPGALYYLTIATPHADAWSFHGPTKTMAALLPFARQTVSASPSAVAKLAGLIEGYEEWNEWEIEKGGDVVEKELSPTFSGRGFTTLVVEEDREEYTELEVVREINGTVAEVLPASVYTVTSHGPLIHDFSSSLNAQPASPKGLASTSRIVRSYVTAQEAKIAANRVMDNLVKNEQNVSRTESCEGHGKGMGLLMAMNGRKTWEVRIQYEEDALKGAVERFDKEPRNVERGRKATWRLEI